MPRVSVIIPSRNRPNLLAEAIDSVLAQSFVDFEIIVQDDGSEDSTAERVGRYTDRRVRYERREQAGRSAARNRGIERAQGELIAFLDDDDLFLPSKVENQVAYFEARPHIDGLAGAALLGDSAGAPSGGTLRRWKEARELTLPMFLYGYGLLPSTAMVRHAGLQRMTARWFDVTLDYAEDTDFFIRFLHSGCRLDWSPEPTCIYRRHRSNAGWLEFVPLLAYERILDRLFARTDLAPAILEEKPAIYASCHLRIACGAYGYGIVPLAKFHLEKAVALDPGLFAGARNGFIRMVLIFARFHPIGDQEAYIGCVFDNLPDRCEALRAQLPDALEASRQGENYDLFAD